jgi:ATP-dependent protease ClpP protease subunit
MSQENQTSPGQPQPTAQPQPQLPAVPPPVIPNAVVMVPQPKTIYINFFDGISDPKVKALMAMLSEIVARQKPEVLYFLFSTSGGSVAAGIVLHNFLRALPVEIIMHNTGSVDSIGTIIFLAAAKRYGAPQSTFLFHGVQTMFPPNVPISHPQLVERLSMIKEDENKIAGIIAARSNLSETEIRQLFHQGESKNLAFAKEKGIIDDVRDAAIPKDAPFVTINLN